MKTDKNSRTQTRAGADAHPEQAIPDTNPGQSRRQKKWKTYEISFIRTSDFSGIITAKGRTEEEAIKRASDKIYDLDAADLENTENEICYQVVRQVEGDADYE